MKLEADQFKTSRGNLALELLAKGEDMIQIPPISITNSPEEKITLLVWSSWTLDNLTKEKAIKEIQSGWKIFQEILNKWPELKEMLHGKTIPCFLHEDYGMGSIRICELKENGDIEWEISKFQNAI